MSRHRADHRAAGFTLIEALVALAILGSVLGTVYAIVGEGLRQTKRDEDRVLLALVARNLLVRSRLDLAVDGESLSGDIEGGLRWTIASAPYAPPELPEELEASDSTAEDDERLLDEEEGGLFAPREEAADPDADAALEPDAEAAAADARAVAEGAPGEAARPGDDTPGLGQPRRNERLELRLIRVTVEKADLRFELTGLAPVPQEAQRARRP